MEMCHDGEVQVTATGALGWYCVYLVELGSNRACFNLLNFHLHQISACFLPPIFQYGFLYLLDTKDIFGDVLILPVSGCGKSRPTAAHRSGKAKCLASVVTVVPGSTDSVLEIN